MPQCSSHLCRTGRYYLHQRAAGFLVVFLLLKELSPLLKWIVLLLIAVDQLSAFDEEFGASRDILACLLHIEGLGEWREDGGMMDDPRRLIAKRFNEAFAKIVKESR